MFFSRIKRHPGGGGSIFGSDDDEQHDLDFCVDESKSPLHNNDNWTKYGPRAVAGDLPRILHRDRAWFGS